MKRFCQVLTLCFALISWKAQAVVVGSLTWTIGVGVISALTGNSGGVAESRLYSSIERVNTNRLSHYRSWVYKTNDVRSFNQRNHDIAPILDEVREILLETYGPNTPMSHKSLSQVRDLVSMRANDFHDRDRILAYYDFDYDTSVGTLGEFIGTGKSMTAKNYYYLSHILYRAFHACQYRLKQCY